MIGRFAEEHKDLAVICVVPAGDVAKARALWEGKGMKGACLVDPGRMAKDWGWQMGTYYLVGRDGMLASGVLTDLPDPEKLGKACAP